MTWELVVILCKNELGIETTRKTLLTRDSIKTAMKLRKVELKAPSQAPREFTDIDRANDRIARLTRRVAELEKAHETLIDQFARWAYNADAHGLNEAILKTDPEAAPLMASRFSSMPWPFSFADWIRVMTAAAR